MKRLSLSLALALLLTGCAAPGYNEMELSPGGVPAVKTGADLSGPGAQAMTDLAVDLLQTVPAEDNALLSPLSVMYALSMTANGAVGETRSQMEDVLGLPTGELNGYLAALARSLPDSKDARLALANSVWFRDSEGLAMEQPFLDANRDYYGAGLYKAPFDDSTVKDINGWVSDHTDGMIPTIISQIPEATMVYLINALAFDAKWADIYREDQIRDGTFTTQDGQARQVEMMYGAETLYLESDTAAGFLKPYEGGTYAFAAILPEEGLSLDEYIAALTGEDLRAMLTSPRDELVQTAIPKLELEFETELSDALSALGMAGAFDPSTADFSAMGKSDLGGLYISQVIHKTALSLDEQGTRAGAATAVAMDAGGAMDPLSVYLDRPFLCLLVDMDHGTPLFIGAVRDIGR